MFFLDLYFFGAVAHAMAIGMFIYFVYINYTAAKDQAFISLSRSEGSCETVPISITGEYLADNNGNWIGTPDFVESNALYSIQFSNFQITSIEQYNSMMLNFYYHLENVGNFSSTITLAENLILLMTYIQYYYIII